MYMQSRGQTVPTKKTDWKLVDRNWENEFEADRHSILAIDDPMARSSLAKSAILFFLYLEFLEIVLADIDPAFASVATHPPTSDRLEKIINEFGPLVEIDLEWSESALSHVRDYADSVKQHRSENDEIFSFYGSIYLGQWKGPELIDRLITRNCKFIASYPKPYPDTRMSCVLIWLA